MRSCSCILGLLLACLVTPATQAHSRSFAWFFAHSRPQGPCSGQHVVATFYASGRRTASGQTFDSSGYTAAHRTLPFGSRVTITNPENGRSATVVINDRGPFTRGVTIDLARGAARAIGMHRINGYACSDERTVTGVAVNRVRAAERGANHEKALSQLSVPLCATGACRSDREGSAAPP